MKYYKIENERFTGFYDKDINKEQIFDITFVGEEEILTLKHGFYEISDNNYSAVLDEQSKGKQIFYDFNDKRLVNLSQEELKLEKIIPLEQGELTSDGKVVIVPIPESLIKPIWISPNWVEAITKEELVEIRANKILEYEKLNNEKTVLENSKFSTTEETETLNIELENLKNEINEIALKIKGM